MELFRVQYTLDTMKDMVEKYELTAKQAIAIASNLADTDKEEAETHNEIIVLKFIDEMSYLMQ